MDKEDEVLLVEALEYAEDGDPYLVCNMGYEIYLFRESLILHDTENGDAYEVPWESIRALIGLRGDKDEPWEPEPLRS